MAKKKEQPLRIVLQISTFKQLKGERKRAEAIRRHKKDSPLYSTTINSGNKQIQSRKIYLPVSASDVQNEKRISAITKRYFKRFTKTEQNHFTVTAQYFQGDVRNHYRAKIQGKVSKGAHFDERSFDFPKFKREIAKLNRLRVKRGRPKLNLQKNLDARLENISSSLKTNFRALEKRTTSPTEKKKPTHKKRKGKKK